MVAARGYISNVRFKSVETITDALIAIFRILVLVNLKSEAWVAFISR